jgi:hypothetical protein
VTVNRQSTTALDLSNEKLRVVQTGLGARGRAWIFAVSLLLPGSLPGQPQENLSPRPVLTLYMKGADGCPPRLLEEMRSEVEDIMRPAGLSLDWRHLDPSQNTEPVSALVVLTFVGTCRSEGQCNPAKPLGPLGWTHITDGEILPFCAVDCDRVRQVVTPVIRCESRAERDRLYGRALGRVVAHELYHILANTTAHSRRGLAKPVLAAAELVLDVCRFGIQEIGLIRKAVARRLFGGVTADPLQVNSGGQ